MMAPRMNSLISMTYPEFEPGTFGVADDFPSHYTSWSALSTKQTELIRNINEKHKLMQNITVSTFKANRLISTTKLMPYQQCLFVLFPQGKNLKTRIVTHSLCKA